MNTLILFSTTYELPYDGLLPALSAEQFSELKESIREEGQQVPILLHRLRVIDGGHRLRALCELASEGVEVTPLFRFVQGLTLAKEKQLALDLNLKRRQLSPEERASVVLRLRQEGHSQRQIAEMAGIPKSTVARDLAGAPSGAPEIKGKDGKTYPASRPSLLISTPIESSMRATSMHDAAEEKRYPSEEVCTDFGQDEPKEEARVEAPPTPVFIQGKIEAKKGPAAIQPSGFDGWNTPPNIVALLKGFGLFGISLDPCSNEHSQVGAHLEFDLEEDGLNTDWLTELAQAKHEGGLIFVNPPYDQETLAQVAIKSSSQALKGAEIIALVPAKVDQGWYQDEVAVFASAICFVKGRVPFWRDGAPAQGSAFACLLIYWGRDHGAFCEMFAGLGRCLDLQLLREASAEEEGSHDPL